MLFFEYIRGERNVSCFISVGAWSIFYDSFIYCGHCNHIFLENEVLYWACPQPIKNLRPVVVIIHKLSSVLIWPALGD